MGLRHRIRSLTSSKVKNRLFYGDKGSIHDKRRDYAPVGLVKSDFLSSFVDNMAARVGPDALRTLRYASSDEWAATLESTGFSWSGPDPNKWRGFREFWRDEGHQGAVLITEAEGKKYIIESSAPIPIAAGNMRAALDYSTRVGLRVGLETISESSAIMSVQYSRKRAKDRPISTDKPIKKELGNLTAIYSDEITLQREGGLYWLDSRCSILPFRLMDLWRMEAGFIQNIEFNGNEESWEESVCKSISQCFIESGDLIMVENDASWFEISKRRISRMGFGILQSAKMCDGVLTLILQGPAQPYVVAGFYMGYVYRAYGKKILPKWGPESDGFHLKFNLN